MPLTQKDYSIREKGFGYDKWPGPGIEKERKRELCRTEGGGGGTEGSRTPEKTHQTGDRWFE